MHDELEVLFEESSALANRLKKNARLLHRNDNLSASGRGLLQSLQMHGPQTVPQLALARSTSRQNIQVLVDRLAADGYIGFSANPGHKRSDFVALTAQGRGLLASANEREAGLLASLSPQTSGAEVKQAAELMRRIRLQMGGERKRRRKPVPASAGRRQVAAPVESPAGDGGLPVNLL